jgi:hypothetical protein
MEEQKGFFTKKFTAEFNTSQDSLRQLATMEWNIDTMFATIYTNGLNKLDLPGIDTLYHYLVYVYADRLWSLSWTILQFSSNKEDLTFTTWEKELEILYLDWKTKHEGEVPTMLIRRLREYKRWLYEVKQKQIKLGIPTKVETTSKERLEKAMGV